MGVSVFVDSIKQLCILLVLPGKVANPYSMSGQHLIIPSSICGYKCYWWMRIVLIDGHFISQTIP